MVAIDMDKMRKGHEEHQRGGDFVGFEKGDTLVYVHPPCRDNDEWEPTTGTNFIPVVVHYKVGKNGGMAVSLDKEKNPIIEHPFIKKLLKAQKKKIIGDCPVAKALSDGTISGDAADESRAQTRFLWGMTPLKHRSNAKMPWADLEPKPSTAFIGKQIFDGIMEVFFDNGDIADPNGAVLVRITKEGDGRTTKYAVKAEPSTLKEPFKLPKALKAKLSKAMEEGGDCDLFRIVANMTKSTAEVQAMVDGVAVSGDPEDNDDEDEKPVKGAKKSAKAAVEDDDDDEDDEATEKTRKKIAAKGKKAPEPEDEDDEDEDEDDEEEDEDEEPVKPSKSKAPPAKSKKAPEPEEDEDDEEEDDEDDEEEVPPAKPSKSKAPPPKPAKGKKAAEPDDEDDEPVAPKKPAGAKSKAAKPADDDDDDIGDLEEALADLFDDEDDKPPPPKPKKGK
jgi:hypothetical protein